MNSPLGTPLAALAGGRLAVQRFRWNQLRRQPKLSGRETPEPEPASASAQSPSTSLPNPFLPHLPSLYLLQLISMLRLQPLTLLRLLPYDPWVHKVRSAIQNTHDIYIAVITALPDIPFRDQQDLLVT